MVWRGVVIRAKAKCPHGLKGWHHNHYHYMHKFNVTGRSFREDGAYLESDGEGGGFRKLVFG